MVLDLDETLIHSHHDGVIRQTVKPGTPPDFSLRVVIDRHPVRFFVHKRPHVDYFLEIVSGCGFFLFIYFFFSKFFSCFIPSLFGDGFRNGSDHRCSASLSQGEQLV
jgi:hypothetical protein